MKSKYKKKWIEALLSGEYLQGKTKLVTVEKDGTHYFCCLAVLCDILPPEISNWKASKKKEIVTITTDGSSVRLSEAIMKYAGISENEMNKLIIMNDVKKHKFKTIAKWIDKHL